MLKNNPDTAPDANEEPMRAGLNQFMDNSENPTQTDNASKPGADDKPQNMISETPPQDPKFPDRSSNRRRGRRRSKRTHQWTVKLKPEDIERITEIADELECVYAAVIEQALDELEKKLKK